LPHLDAFSALSIGGVALLVAGIVAVVFVRRRVAPHPSPAPPAEADTLPNVRAWLAAAPDHAASLRHIVSEHPQLRARAEAAEQALEPLRDRAVHAEQQCEQLRQELDRRHGQLEAIRKDWDEVTQRVSQILLEILEKKHDAQ